MRKDRREPAFPGIGREWCGPGLADYGDVNHTGMTLRDYFAAKALTGLGAYWANSDVEVPNDEWAKRAYGIADAMLAERAKP